LAGQGLHGIKRRKSPFAAPWVVDLEGRLAAEKTPKRRRICGNDRAGSQVDFWFVECGWHIRNFKSPAVVSLDCLEPIDRGLLTSALVRGSPGVIAA
jgi:hypothetical protein